MKCKTTNWGLKVGTKIEMEHTKSKTKARKIATDHLREFGDCYYVGLIKLEKKLSRQQNKR